MQKNIKKIIFTGIISILFLSPFILKAALVVTTNTADNITDAGATLHGMGIPDLTLNPKLPTTAYFRYSDTPVAPVFCNDIYGNDMISTLDINLNINGGSQYFFQNIYDLKYDTTYYYCAIISNKKNIVYGTVKNFHTTPCSVCVQTTVITNNATNINSTSAYLKGSYGSTKKIKTYFEYREGLTNEMPKGNAPVVQEPWIKINSSEQIHNANSYGNASFLLSGLKTGTKYNFRFVAKTIENIPETFNGTVLSFTTNSTGGGTGWTYVPETITSFSGSTNGISVYDGNGTEMTTTINTIGSTNLVLGQIATAPSDAIVHYHEGIETVFVRQIIANPAFAKRYGYIEGANLEVFAWGLADLFARVFGYVNTNGREIRVIVPDMAAYQLSLVGSKLIVYEYFNGKIVNIQSMSENLRNTYEYEYYFKK